jgi:hypothetical protein
MSRSLSASFYDHDSAQTECHDHYQRHFMIMTRHRLNVMIIIIILWLRTICLVKKLSITFHSEAQIQQCTKFWKLLNKTYLCSREPLQDFKYLQVSHLTINLAYSKYRYVQHNDVLVNDRQNVQRSYNIIILTTVLQLPTIFSTVTCCRGL